MMKEQAETEELRELCRQNDSLRVCSFRYGDQFVYLRVRAEHSYFAYSILKLEGDKWIPIESKEHEGAGYYADSIQDVNHDGYLDLVHLRYAPSGCCRREYHEAHLYNPQSKAWDKILGFMNPTYFPEKKEVRGVCYGFFGEAPLYRMKWNG
ncbi:MAG: hypothetical protein AAF804_15510 [Bacteroidota bacterium]